MRKYYFFLFIVFVLGLILRFYRLGDIPVGFHRDEAFFGYNAYSILHTARDMSGNFLPLHLQSFIFSPAGYSYLSIPFIFLFDLSAFSVRFASALFGSLTVLLSFFLSLEIFSRNKNKHLISLAGSFFLAISPWNINLARTATENTIVVFFITLATLLFFIALKKKQSVLLLLSFISYSVTLFIYQAPRAFLPLFIPAFFILLFPGFGDIKKKIKIAILFIFLIIIPVVFIISSKDLSLRIRTLSIFSGGQSGAILQEYISADGVTGVQPSITRLFHNKFEAYSSEILQNYFKHFSYDFLFTDKGLPDRYRIPSMGLMYIFELPLLLLGVWAIIKNKNKSELSLLVWIVLAPIGSALTFDDVPNLQRTLILFPALSMVIGLGFVHLSSCLDSYRVVKKYALGGLMAVIAYSFVFYLHQYYVHASRYNPWYRQDGYKELIGKVNNLLPAYKKVIITNRESAPSVFSLFYSRYNTALFQKETMNEDKNVSDSTNFGKFIFSDEECPFRETGEGVGFLPDKDALYVNSGNCKTPTDAKILDIIRRGDSSKVFEVLSYE